jgi:hypothetical protein
VDYREILDIASDQIVKMCGETIDIIQLNKPTSVEQAKELTKIVSKLSPVFGNMIEFKAVERLNAINWGNLGRWVRQDPGFPDALFVSNQLDVPPGIEIKTWYPLSTEITARFKESKSMFKDDNTLVALMCWIPEYVVYGRAKIIDVWIGTASGIAKSRDAHYHDPPGYLVMEPGGTSDRTSNLIQTNTGGYKFQGTASELDEAKRLMKDMIIDEEYSIDQGYQDKIMTLRGEFKYRMDTNYAKIDRIQHEGIELFKSLALQQEYMGKTISEWKSVLCTKSKIDSVLAELLDL